MDHEPPVDSFIESIDQLDELYRSPSRIVQNKKLQSLDEASTAFIKRSPFLLIATSGVDGGADVSPRGGPPGFVRVLDNRHVVIPDLNGNNLIDSLRGIVATRRAGLLFVVPGKDETLRFNGAAWLTAEDSVLDLWHGELRRPTTAIVVRADEVFIHCAKAFRRGQVWDPSSWAAIADAPNGAEILCAQGLVESVGPALLEAMERGYAADLAADAPDT